MARHRRRRSARIPTALVCLPARARRRPGCSARARAEQGLACNGFLASSVDGTLLDVSVAVPAGPGRIRWSRCCMAGVAAGRATATSPIRCSRTGTRCCVIRRVASDARGGQVNLADIHVELEDLRSMIGQVVDQPELALNADAVGVTGVSYGGGQTWLALHPAFQSPHGANVRIRAVVPIVPWTDLVYSLLPNGRPECRSIRPARPS